MAANDSKYYIKSIPVAEDGTPPQYDVIFWTRNGWTKAKIETKEIKTDKGDNLLRPTLIEEQLIENIDQVNLGGYTTVHNQFVMDGKRGIGFAGLDSTFLIEDAETVMKQNSSNGRFDILYLACAYHRHQKTFPTFFWNIPGLQQFGTGGNPSDFIGKQLENLGLNPAFNRLRTKLEFSQSSNASEVIITLTQSYFRVGTEKSIYEKKHGETTITKKSVDYFQQESINTELEAEPLFELQLDVRLTREKVIQIEQAEQESRDQCISDSLEIIDNDKKTKSEETIADLGIILSLVNIGVVVNDPKQYSFKNLDTVHEAVLSHLESENSTTQAFFEGLIPPYKEQFLAYFKTQNSIAIDDNIFNSLVQTLAKLNVPTKDVAACISLDDFHKALLSHLEKGNSTTQAFFEGLIKPYKEQFEEYYFEYITTGTKRLFTLNPLDASVKVGGDKSYESYGIERKDIKKWASRIAWTGFYREWLGSPKLTTDPNEDDQTFLKTFFRVVNPFYFLSGAIHTVQDLFKTIDALLYGQPLGRNSVGFWPVLFEKGDTVGSNQGTLVIRKKDPLLVKFIKGTLALVTYPIRLVSYATLLTLEAPRFVLKGLGRAQEFLTFDFANAVRKGLNKLGEQLSPANGTDKNLIPNAMRRPLKMLASITLGLVPLAAVAAAGVFLAPAAIVAIPAFIGGLSLKATIGALLGAIGLGAGAVAASFGIGLKSESTVKQPSHVTPNPPIQNANAPKSSKTLATTEEDILTFLNKPETFKKGKGKAGGDDNDVIKYKSADTMLKNNILVHTQEGRTSVYVLFDSGKNKKIQQYDFTQDEKGQFTKSKECVSHAPVPVTRLYSKKQGNGDQKQTEQTEQTYTFSRATSSHDEGRSSESEEVILRRKPKN